MDPEFRRHFYGALNAMPLERAQEQGAIVAHMRAVHGRGTIVDMAMEHAGGGVEELEKTVEKMRVQAAAGMLVFLNRKFLL